MATSEPYFGAEVVDVDDGGQYVQELKAATAFIVGTAPIHEVHDTAEKRAPYINKRILVRRKEDIAGLFGPERDGYTLPTALKAMFDESLASGIGTIVVVNVFDPDTHKGADGTPDPTQVGVLDIVGTFNALGAPSGLQHAFACYQAFGFFPKILLAPGFTNLVGVKTELEIIANRIRARFLLDAPFGVTPQQALEARGENGLFDWQTNSNRAVLLWPHVMRINRDDQSPQAGVPVALPYSPTFAGLWLRSVIEYGYHHSPSNRPIKGIEDAAQDVLYIPGDHQSVTQLLRSAGVVTVEERWGKGPHTSGNRNAAYPTMADMRNFMHVLFIQDMLDEAVLFYLDQWKDRNANPATLEMIEDKINTHLRAKTIGRDPVLYDGRFRFDRKKTTPESVASGQFFWTLEYAPIGIMERLTVERAINIELIRNPLGLARADAA